MNGIDIDACASELVALAALIRNAAHGREDALALHDVARSVEAAAGVLIEIKEEANRRWAPG